MLKRGNLKSEVAREGGLVKYAAHFTGSTWLVASYEWLVTYEIGDAFVTANAEFCRRYIREIGVIRG